MRMVQGYPKEWTIEAVLSFLPEVACSGCDWCFEWQDYKHTKVTFKHRGSGMSKTILYDVSQARTQQGHQGEIKRLIGLAEWVGAEKSLQDELF